MNNNNVNCEAAMYNVDRLKMRKTHLQWSIATYNLFLAFEKATDCLKSLDASIESANYHEKFIHPSGLKEINESIKNVSGMARHYAGWNDGSAYPFVGTTEQSTQTNSINQIDRDVQCDKIESENKSTSCNLRTDIIFKNKKRIETKNSATNCNYAHSNEIKKTLNTQSTYTKNENSIRIQ